MEQEGLSDELFEEAVALAAKKFSDQPPGFPFERNIDWSAIQLPPEYEQQLKDESNEDDEDDLADFTEDTGFESVIVVDNLPVVKPEKIEKLTALIKKIFSTVGPFTEDGFDMPFDGAQNQTKGFCFIEFEDPETAAKAKELGHNYRLDKNHTFSVCMFDDFDRYTKVPDNYTPLEVPPYQPKEDIYSYMLDRRGLDQFVMRYKDETEIYWWDGKRSQALEVFKKNKMTEMFVTWSPFGTYFATCHRQGIAIWGGPNFDRFQRFPHPGVSYMEFSPEEMYLTACSLPRNKDGTPSIWIKVFNVRTGALLRVFQGPIHEFVVGKDGDRPNLDDFTWPLLKWAGGSNDKYFAKLGTSKNQEGMISVYETPDMVLLEKKSLKLEAVQTFEWSPSDPYLCIYQRENGNLPARISLMKIPEKVEMRQKNLFNVKDVFIHWHPQGDFLAICVQRHTRTKKTIFYGFEFFRIREKDIPMEVLELPKNTDKILEFAWEPNGTRFVVVHGNGPMKYDISFFNMKREKSTVGVESIGTLNGKIVEKVYWSPKGGTIIFVGPSPGGVLEFFSVDLFETMNTGEHYLMTCLEWDPSGRYVTTYVSPIHETDNGYTIWTFQGRLLKREPQDEFFQFLWRPRRPSLLSSETKQKIEKNLKSYSKRYEEEDEVLLKEADTELLEMRRQQTEEWESWKHTNESYAEQHARYLQEMYGDSYAESEFEMKTVELEQVVDVKEEIYKRGL